MFYSCEEIPHVNAVVRTIANIDLCCDLVPVISTVTNLARFAIAGTATASHILVCTPLAIGFTLKVFVDWTRGVPHPVTKNLKECCSIVYKLKTLWMRSFFTFHYLKKGMSYSIIHSLPLIGNVHAYIQMQNCFSQGVEKQVKLHIVQELRFFKKWGFLNHFFPLLKPSYLAGERDNIIEQVQHNIYLVKQIPKEYFQEFDFAEQVLKAMTLSLSPSQLEHERKVIKELFEYVINIANQFHHFEDIPVPFEQLFISGKVIDIVKKYPFLIWAFSSHDFFQQKKYIMPLLQEYPHVVVCLSHHFLKVHPLILQKALAMKPELACYFDETLLLQAFGVKDALRNDPVFLTCCASKPGLKKRLDQALERRAVLQYLKIT